MIHGLGLDVVEVSRIQKAMENPRFLPRVLTESERKICYTPQRVAGRWAAKEAIYKCLGDPSVTWQDIEVLNNEAGAPVVTKPHGNWRLSITHERGIAAAVAILVEAGPS